MNFFIKQQGQGKPLILLHGWGFNGEIWNTIAAELSQQWTVYQVDLPGHGRSPMSEYRLPTLVEQLATDLPQKAVWIGWSLGGLLALAMARWQPASVRALVLVASSPRFVTAADWPHAMTPTVLEHFAQQLQHDTMGTLHRFLALQVKGSQAARQQLRTLQALLKKTGVPQAEALQAGLTLLQNTDLRSELLQIRSQALLCLGGHDTLVPAAMGKNCQQWWPALHKVCIKPAAHIPFLSHPELFLPILQDFLSQ
ncbi:MAG: pimeloyl-[acyl-carrier protein] methyl ester esterase [Candidatus Parabeggiatoa sp. nov. 3]|nr:MAG: pimeloyl-[acyl-carrier protein] methyl ester esterase [Gammaproteobacteria bacterium]RKZ52429.1 MAG: pimeloyl-[acyl-carrier protein] methyl ester esterase [Gammaproteobacteria bacterium]RKZ83157.1 MAG: pimeloyl-[acyl-carrier protein] methyl ester esterase [Gammaproteobacteria bacterium]